MRYAAKNVPYLKLVNIPGVEVQTRQKFIRHKKWHRSWKMGVYITPATNAVSERGEGGRGKQILILRKFER